MSQERVRGRRRVLVLYQSCDDRAWQLLQCVLRVLAFVLWSGMTRRISAAGSRFWRRRESMMMNSIDVISKVQVEES